MNKAFKYRIEPTDPQKELIAQTIGCCRFVWNWALEKKIADKQSKTLSWGQISKDLTAMKQQPEYVWLNVAPAQALIAELQHLQQAFARFFSNVKKGIKPFGFPRFKRRDDKRSFSLQNNVKRTQNRLALQSRREGLLYVIKFEGIPLVYHRPHTGTVGTVTISVTPAGRYYASLTTDDGIDLPEPKGGKAIAIKRTRDHVELISTYASAENASTVIPHPLIFRSKLKRLKVLDRRLTLKRKENKHWKESKRYQQLKFERARLHEYIANARADWQHKLTAGLVEEYDEILIDTIDVKGLMMKRKDSLTLADCALYEIERQLKYKCQERGKLLHKI